MHERDSDEPLFEEVTERFWVFELITEVREDGLYVRFTPVQRSFRRLSSDEIQTVSATSYSATDYAGWHWGMRRTPGGHTVYRLHGDRGVEITQRSGDRWFIGSERPEALAMAIEQIREER